mgnify:CR=1 FL=1
MRAAELIDLLRQYDPDTDIPVAYTDADFGGQPGGVGLGGEFGDAADGAQALELAVLEHGQPGGVIAPIFQLAQAFEQHGDDVATGNGGDDATHRGSLFKEIRPHGPD